MPILKFRKGNNFHKFKSALALEEYGDLRKLIKKEAYYIPQFITPDYSRQSLTQVEQDAMRLNRLKSHHCQKLYGLIWRHMSAESKDELRREPDYEVRRDATDPEKLCKAIVKTHKVDCVSSVDAIKELAA